MKIIEDFELLLMPSFEQGINIGCTGQYTCEVGTLV
jgi:hypothetical protein